MDKYFLYDFAGIDEHLNKFNRIKKTNKIALVAMIDKETVFSEDFFRDVNEFLSMCAEKNIGPHDIQIAIAGEDKDFSTAEWQKLKQIREKLQSKGVALGIEDYRKTWSIEEVENANAQIEQSADKLRGKNFSPMEKLLSAYLDVTKRTYTSETQTEHASQSRSVYGVLNSDKIVCVGYAALLKAIIEKEGDENIKLYYNSVACSEDNVHLGAYHRNLIVYLKDEKYGIDGYYYVDPTWDSSASGKNEFKLNHFLVPLKDIPHITTHIRDYNANLQPSENRSNIKPKHITQKTQKAIIKSKERAYNYSTEANASFSSDKFVFSKGLEEHITQNDEAWKIISEYFDLSDEIIKDLQTPRHKPIMDEIKNYLKENNINFLNYEINDYLCDLVKNNASMEECFDYADSIVERLRFGKKDISDEEFKQLFLNKMRESLEKEYNLPLNRQFLDAFASRSGELDDKTAEHLEKLKKEVTNDETNIDKALNTLSEIFTQDRDFMYRFCDSLSMETDEFYFGSFCRSIKKLDEINPQTVKEQMETSLRKKHDLCIDAVFEWVDRTINDGLSPEEIDKSKYKIKTKTVYDALCEASEPITGDKISRALFNVITKRNEKITPAEVKTAIDKIMEINTRHSKVFFTEGASNAFSVAREHEEQAKKIETTQK